MPKSVFIYICSCVLLLQLFSLSSEPVNQVINAIAITGILTIGIAHGSIDHVLFLKNRKLGILKFLLVYLAILLLNFVLWFIFPLTALLLFLIFSAYHFGQSQLVELKMRGQLLKKLSYIIWGTTVLSALLFFNEQEVSALFAQTSPELNSFGLILPYVKAVFYGSLLAMGIIFIYQLLKGQLSVNKVGLELIQLSLILISFYLFPVILGFSLYFIILHSFRVLVQEYQFLRRESKVNNKKEFTQLLMPFTLTSIFGLGLITFAVFYFNIPISFPYLLVALTSAVTIPHAMVMEVFYTAKTH